jgi:tetratricopeptide (TPR) repeat protein
MSSPTIVEPVDIAQTFATGEERYRAADYAAAEAIFARLSVIQEQDAAILRMLGLSRLRLGQQEQALRLLEEAHALAPTDPYARLHYGLGLHAVGKHAEAAAAFRACVPLIPSDPAPYLNLSAALLALGDTPGAIDAARRARRRHRKLPQGAYMVGMAYLAGGRLGEALDAFFAALRLDPKLVDAWVNIGVIRYRQNDIEAAKIAMRRARFTLRPGVRALL